MNNKRFFILCGMVFIAATARLIPHPPNFTPIAALALFSGANFPCKHVAFTVPLAALLLSDLMLGFYPISLVIYGSFALIVCLGFPLRRRHTLWRLASASVVGAVIFFVLTNFGVWILGGMYPKTGAGLGACFVAAIPFFWNTLLSDLMYAAILFGGLKLAEKCWPVLAEQHPVIA